MQGFGWKVIFKCLKNGSNRLAPYRKARNLSLSFEMIHYPLTLNP